MLILRGSPALSQFRLQKLLQDLAAAGLPVRAISAEFVHLVDLVGPGSACGEPAESACGEPAESARGDWAEAARGEPAEAIGLTDVEQGILAKLLTYGPSRAAAEVKGILQVVAPRPGTISPWSSKATDIAHTAPWRT